MRPRARWHDRRNGSSSGSASRLVRTSSARLRRHLWSGSSGESGRSREGPRASALRRQWKSWSCVCGGGAAISAFAKRRGVDRPHSLGPAAIAGRSVASVENTTSPSCGTDRIASLGGTAQYGRQRPWPLVHRPEQGPFCWAFQRLLQIARSPNLDRNALAQLLEQPCTDPYARWCGRGGAERLPPYPDPWREADIRRVRSEKCSRTSADL